MYIHENWFDFGLNTPIILGVIALFQLNFDFKKRFPFITFENIIVLKILLY